jgi:hypothetical protein
VQFLGAGAALFVAGGIAVVFFLCVALRKREGPWLARGWLDLVSIFLCGLLVNALVLSCLSWHGSVGPEYGEEVFMIGFAYTIPVAELATWTGGELLSGPTRGSGWMLVPAFVASAVGMVGQFVVLPRVPLWPGHDRFTFSRGRFGWASVPRRRLPVYTSASGANHA